MPSSQPSTLIESADSWGVLNATQDLITAAQSGSISAVEEVINRMGTEAATGNNFGHVALVSAIYGGKANIATILVEKGGVDINDQGHSGNTALMFAAMWGQLESVRALLELGASRSIKNNDGLTALELSRKAGHRDVTALLRVWG